MASTPDEMVKRLGNGKGAPRHGADLPELEESVEVRREERMRMISEERLRFLAKQLDGSVAAAAEWTIAIGWARDVGLTGLTYEEIAGLVTEVSRLRQQLAAAHRDAAAIQTLRDFYDTERNCQLSSFWDAGWAVQVGDTINGLRESSGGLPDPVEAIEWLRGWMGRNPVEGENGD